MLRKSESRKTSLIITLAFCLTMSLASLSYASGGITGGTIDYLNAPAVGSSVVGYLFAEYLDAQTSYFNIFVRRCECLKRLTYTDTGVMVTYPQVLTLEEFNGITPAVLVGMADTNGQLSTALAGGQSVIAVIEQVLEFKKVGNRFMARVSMKFVSTTP